MRLIALDTFDNRREGEEFECSDHQGRRLIEKGLAKMGQVPENKMAPPSSNKADPSAADGEAQPSSASPAAPASPQTTAEPYPGGGSVTPDPRFVEADPEGVTQKAKTRAEKAAATRAANKAARGE